MNTCKIERRSNYIFRNSKYKWKRGILDCIKWLIEREMLFRFEDWGDKRGTRKTSKKMKKPHVSYKLTGKGFEFLEMIK